MVPPRKRDGREPLYQPNVENFLLAQETSQVAGVQPDRQSSWQRVQSFLSALSFKSGFLPLLLRHRSIGYLLAVLLPSLIVVGIFSFMADVAPLLHFYSAPVLLVVLLISLGWGTLPGLLATFSGAVMLVSLILIPYASLTFQQHEFVYSTIMFALVGLGVALLSSCIERARQQARKAQGEAETAQANLARILMQAPIPISIIRGPEYHYELINPSAQQTLDRQTPLGKPLQEIFSEQESQVLPLLRQVCATGEGIFVPESRTLRRADDNTLVEHYSNISYQPLRISDGTIDGIIVLGVDVTEQVQARHKIERLLAERENYMSIVAHELRTPITGAKMASQLVQRRIQHLLLDVQQQPESEERTRLLGAVSEHLRHILDQLDLQDRLVSDLLDASRTGADSLELRTEHYNLAQSIKDCVENLRNIYPHRQISLELPPGETLMVTADPERVRQVVTNYLTNALKYSEQEKPVTVIASLQHNEIYVAVRDEGPGLNKEQQKRIWERFYRVPSVQVRSGPGVSLGLGLFICSSIIERHGGRVGVTSFPGEGSTFWFTLPSLSHYNEAATGINDSV
jgi:signal transduction histidine kinase